MTHLLQFRWALGAGNSKTLLTIRGEVYRMQQAYVQKNFYNGVASNVQLWRDL